MSIARREQRAVGIVLVDASAWILVLRGKMDLRGWLAYDALATCPPVMQEVLQGASSPKRYEEYRRMLLETELLDAPVPLERYEEAARLFLRCRDKAFTIRKGYDCLIAACAIAHNAILLHDDSDFDYMARTVGLKALRVTRSSTAARS